MATSGPTKVSWAEIRLWRAALLGAFLLLWEMATRRGWVDPFFVSQPTVLAAQKVEELRSGPFPPAVVIESSEFLGEAGEPVDGSSSTPAFGRVWRTEPLASAPDNAVVITVLVAPYRHAALNRVDERPPGATRLVTLRTRKAP